jgi:lysophospholipase L1-like esterase
MLNRGNVFLNEMETNAVMKVFDFRSVLNLDRQFCEPDLCSRFINDKYMYEDKTHLSSAGSMFIAPALEQALRLLIKK